MARIKFLNMWEGFKPECMMGLISKYADVEIVDRDPDYVICGSFTNQTDKLYELCNYDCVRILLSYENDEPNYNLFDYTVCSSLAVNSDRSIRFPVYLFYIFNWDIRQAHRTYDALRDRGGVQP